MAEPTEPTADVPTPPEATTAEPVLVEPATGEPAVAQADAAEPVEAVVVEEPVAVEQPVVVEEPVVATAEPAPVAAAVAEPASAREVVYVQAPTPPAARHNRGFGVLISLLGVVAFALLYIAAAAIVFAVQAGVLDEARFAPFLTSDAFWVPVGAYAVFAVIFALIVNRAAWWAHVIGSLFVAALTYGVSLGILALIRNVVAMTPDDAVQLFGALASSALLLCVLALARETSLWFGLAIAARGRRVKERNATERELYEQSVAERRAEYERAHPA